MKHVARTVIVLAIALSLVGAAAAQAYVLTGKRWASNSSTWPNYRVYVDYHTLPSDWRNEAYEARMEWNNTGSSKQYFYYSDTSGQELYRGSYGNTTWLALTTLTTSAGLITDVGTKVNTDFSWAVAGYPSPWQYDLQSALAHELGHWLSLDHSSSSSATMYGGLAPGTWWQRTLASDDVSGIRAIYGSK